MWNIHKSGEKLIMRKVSAGIMLMIMLCSSAHASISREVVEAAWKRMTEADGFEHLPINYESTSSPNAWVKYESGNKYSVHVTAGLMAMLNNEDEMAGVWGHEIGHVRCGHYTQDVSRAQGWRVLGVALGALGGTGGAIAQVAGGIGMGLAEQGFSRGQEVEADDYGVTLLKKAGYDPYALYRAMKTMADNGAVTQPSGFSSHPPTERRLVHLQNKAKEVEGLVASVPEESAEVKRPAAKVRKARSSRPAVASTPKEPGQVLALTTLQASPRPAVASLTSSRPAVTRTLASRPAAVTPVSERLSVQPRGMRLEGARTYSGAVIGAYQKVYAMNFEVWKPGDLPAGWYATFDGFPVAQIAENRWVYGQLGIDGAIHPTNILVGSVVPSSIPGITRIAAVWSYGKALDSPEFQRIREMMCNRMGWLNDNYVNTIIAWHTNRIGVWVWLGDRWRRFEPRSGEYTWQMLKRISPYIADELRKNHAWYQGGEPTEVADLARQWGYIWSGRVILQSLKAFKDSGGDGASTVTSMRDSSPSEGGNATPPEPEQTSPQWDVD